MRRGIFNILSAVSLVLAIAIGLLWVRSYWIYDAYSFTLHTPIYTVNSVHGCLSLNGFVQGSHDYKSHWSSRSISTWSRPLNFWADGYKVQPIDVVGFMGFRYRVNRQFPTQPPYFWIVIVPDWFLFLLGCILPARWHHHERIRRRSGLCLTCGYDLRASKDKCPECGAGIPGKSAA